MYNRFRIQQARDKRVWPHLSPFKPLSQVDFSTSFDVAPPDVQGWHNDPRQIFETQQMERGHVLHDYGPNIRDGKVIFTHPLLMQDEVDALSMMAYGRINSEWSLWNHRGDKLKVMLTDGWKTQSFRTLLDEFPNDEPSLYEDQIERQAFFWSPYALKMLIARQAGGQIYVGYMGDTLQSLGPGSNPSLAIDKLGNAYAAFDLSGRIYISTLGAGQAIWGAPLNIIRNDPFYPGQQLFDPAASYESPSMITIGNRIWVFYIKTNGSESVIQYRLKGQHWLLESDVPTLGGKKTALTSLLVRSNQSFQDRVILAWVNWDPENLGSSRLVPNIYRTYSTIPQVNYGKDPGGNFVTRTNETIPMGVLNVPTDDISIELMRNPQYDY